jgi:hephaestin
MGRVCPNLLLLRALYASAACAIVVLTVSTPASAGRERTYYIAADEVVWNYVPGGFNRITGKKLPRLQPHDIGTKYVKAVYHEYTDGTFGTLKPRATNMAHMGILGPVIRAEVGDTIVVVFRNNVRFPLSFHVHGLKYEKASEGAPYVDGVMHGIDGNRVAPGKAFTYHFDVPARAGPAAMDGSSVLWMYHSHVDELQDVPTGLIGPIVVSAPGTTREDGTPKDVDREFFVLFADTEESRSLYFKANLAKFVKNPKAAAADRAAVARTEMFSINGYSYGTLPMPTMRVGDRVRWYVMGSMSDFDFHAPHWHGETIVSNAMRSDTMSIGPMGMQIADMVPDNPGTWLFHCHVMSHLQFGMVARFRVDP